MILKHARCDSDDGDDDDDGDDGGDDDDNILRNKNIKHSHCLLSLVQNHYHLCRPHLLHFRHH